MERQSAREAVELYLRKTVEEVRRFTDASGVTGTLHLVLSDEYGNEGVISAETTLSEGELDIEVAGPEWSE